MQYDLQRNLNTPLGTVNVHDDRAVGITKPFLVEAGDRKLLLAKLKEAKDQNHRALEEWISSYETTLRPLLVASCLTLPAQLLDSSTAFIHCQAHKAMKRKPGYVGIYELLVKGFSLRPGDFERYVDHIIRTRTFVSEEWSWTIGLIISMMYDYGMICPPDGKRFFRVECDASFSDGKANLSYIIWDEYQVVWAEVVKEVTCSNSIIAEILAAIFALLKCDELGLERVSLYSDSIPVVGTINGDYNIPRCNDGEKDGEKDAEKDGREAYLLLRCLTRKFEKLVGVWKYREMNFLVDDLGRQGDDFVGYTFSKAALERWAEKLSGFLSFKISQTVKASAIIHRFKHQFYSHKVVKTFFVKAQMDRKLDIFLQIKKTLCPGVVTLVIDKFEEKNSHFQSKVRDIVGDNAARAKVNGSTVLSFRDHSQENEKELRVVFDTSVLNQLDLGDGHFTVIIADPCEMEVVKEMKIMELSALSYIFFHGVQFTVIQENTYLRDRVKRAIIARLLKNRPTSQL